MIGRPSMIVIILSFCVTVAAWGGQWLQPGTHAPYVSPNFQLSRVVPMEIGDWQPVHTEGMIKPLEKRKAAALVYDQELQRVYRHRKTGQIVMLLIAYGYDQSDSLQLHRPEICYRANGFRVESHETNNLSPTDGMTGFPITELVTRRILRFEPVTYWTRVGKYLPKDPVSLQLSKLWTGLSGRIPDGILVRVSSLQDFGEEDFELHRSFISDMLMAMKPEDLPILVGPYAETWQQYAEAQKTISKAENNKTPVPVG